MVPLSKSGLAFSERGFESHPLRFFNHSCIGEHYSFFMRRGAGVADQARLESACRLWRPWVRIPPSPLLLPFSVAVLEKRMLKQS
jgi:hypothetical protein